MSPASTKSVDRTKSTGIRLARDPEALRRTADSGEGPLANVRAPQREVKADAKAAKAVKATKDGKTSGN
ncbi:hypothetical protein ACFQ8C_13165 [Streptomyces sp. NPDC056503]|uniref:hypothetical protein n=1 Tax=Streptomyces sp. NPDC056503 TaxID=3345842 RepID=UPI0036BACE96